MKALIVCLILCFSCSARAALFPGLFNTGVDNDGKLLPPGSVDPHYRIIQSADTQFPGPDARTIEPGYPVPPWLEDGPDSRWIALRANPGADDGAGHYAYRTIFDLTGFDVAGVKLEGKWATDNTGLDMVLNGTSLGMSNSGQYFFYTDFEIASGFIDGLNTLDFLIDNWGGPTGLRVEFTNVPEPRPVLIFGFAAACWIVAVRRRRRPIDAQQVGHTSKSGSKPGTDCGQ